MKQIDILIFGGGIAGLWTLARLRKQGFNAYLLETNAIGSGQTIKSQGIIHGGLKYAITGQLNSSATSLQDMPSLWHRCLQGCGEVDLSNVTVLADGQLMWSANKLTGGVAALFASNTLKSQVDMVPKTNWPTIMQDAVIASKLYKLKEIILDVPSLLESIAKPLLPYCLKIDNNYQIELDSSNQIKTITINNSNSKLQIQAQHYIFSAGSGNEALIKSLPKAPSMQRRPLQMVIIKSKKLSPIFGHCIGLSATPRITITTHTAKDGTPIWYLGGRLAEEGVNKTSEELFIKAQQELTSLFPKLNLNDAKYASFMIDRAEAKQENGAKPNSITVFNNNNYTIAWPTKLAFAPLLAEEILTHLKSLQVTPKLMVSNLEQERWLAPKIALPIWDQLL